MEERDVRGEKLGPLGRLVARLGRCPKCGDRLVDELDGDLIAGWMWSPDKWTARSLGYGLFRGVPSVHNVSMPACKRCDRCERWYLGRWAYRRAE